MFNVKPKKGMSRLVDMVKYFDLYLPGIFFDEKKLDQKQLATLTDLRNNGYAIVKDFFSADEMDYFEKDLKKRLEAFDFEFPFVAQNRVEPERDRELIESYFIKGEIGRAQCRREDVGKLGADELIGKEKPSTLKFFNPKDDFSYWNKWLSPFFLPIIESYLGMRPYLVEAYVRRNFPADYMVTNHQWHRDTNHPFNIIKVFFLFSDCKLENGPHHFVEKSHTDFRVNGKQYYEDAEIMAVHSEKEIVKGVFRKGTMIIEDTRGLHKAGIPTEGFRDLGYAVFTPMTFINQKRVSYYGISNNCYKQLSSHQRKFIPKSSVK